DGPADLEIAWGLRGPDRRYRVHRTHRTAKIEAFRAQVPNPAYADAERECENAAQDLNGAQQKAAVLQRGAQELANRASGVGGIFGVLASAGAGASQVGAIAVVEKAKSRLAAAERRLRSTPPTVEQPRMVDVAYPVNVIDATATSQIVLRFSGFGATVEKIIP